MAKEKITITIDKEFRDKVQDLADKEKRSFSQQLCKLAEDKFSEIEKEGNK